jgi:hypothetical protein
VCGVAPSLLLSVRHIGPRRAERLVDGLGDRWADLIGADPERVFGTLRGMGRRRASIAAVSWREVAGSATVERDPPTTTPLPREA